MSPELQKIVEDIYLLETYSDAAGISTRRTQTAMLGGLSPDDTMAVVRAIHEKRIVASRARE